MTFPPSEPSRPTDPPRTGSPAPGAAFPATRTPATRTPTTRTLGRAVALPLAILAAAVSVLSLAVAAWAVSMVHGVRSAVDALGAPSQATATTAPPADPGATTERGAPVDPVPPPTDPTVTTEPPPLTDQTVYTAKYEKVTLRVQVAGCSSRAVDLDQPSASTTDANSDITVSGPCSDPAAKIQFGDDVVASEVTDPSVTPTACANEIRLSPVDQQAAFAARKGRLLCILTSRTAAQGRGDTQKMVVLSILGVSEDNTVAMQVTAWAVPS